ncbi:MAG: hypothetical protein M1836_007062 [Candelina mexicana]|nr:MAG: hypothetical protein M1836_007062 [Candelina mexicana]
MNVLKIKATQPSMIEGHRPSHITHTTQIPHWIRAGNETQYPIDSLQFQSPTSSQVLMTKNRNTRAHASVSTDSDMPVSPLSSPIVHDTPETTSTEEPPRDRPCDGNAHKGKQALPRVVVRTDRARRGVVLPQECLGLTIVIDARSARDQKSSYYEPDWSACRRPSTSSPSDSADSDSHHHSYISDESASDRSLTGSCAPAALKLAVAHKHVALVDAARQLMATVGMTHQLVELVIALGEGVLVGATHQQEVIPAFAIVHQQTTLWVSDHIECQRPAVHVAQTTSAHALSPMSLLEVAQGQGAPADIAAQQVIEVAIDPKQVAPIAIAHRQLAPQNIAHRQPALVDIAHRQLALRDIATRQLAPREFAHRQLVPRDIATRQLAPVGIAHRHLARIPSIRAPFWIAQNAGLRSLWTARWASVSIDDHQPAVQATARVWTPKMNNQSLTSEAHKLGIRKTKLLGPLRSLGKLG